MKSTKLVESWLLTEVYGGRRVGNCEKKQEVDGRYRPPGEETEAFHHSSRFARGLHPRPFLTVTPPVPFLPRQPATGKKKKSMKHGNATVARFAASNDQRPRSSLGSFFLAGGRFHDFVRVVHCRLDDNRVECLRTRPSILSPTKINSGGYAFRFFSPAFLD